MVTVRIGESYGFVLKRRATAIIKEDIWGGRESQGYSQADKF